MTNNQRKALHLYLEWLANDLNDNGYNVKDAIHILANAEVSFTKENCKEIFWRPMQTALFPEKISSEKLEGSEVSTIFEHLNKSISENTGIHVPFPSEEDLRMQSLMKEEL